MLFFYHLEILQVINQCLIVFIMLSDYMVDLNELRYDFNYSCVNFLVWMLSYVEFC